MKKIILNAFAFTLAFILCLSITSCKKSEGDPTESDTVPPSVDSSAEVDTSDKPNSPKPAPTPPPIDNNGSSDTDNSGMISGEMSELTVDISVGETKKVVTNWKKGKVNAANLKLESAEGYSYSDVITIKKAGTTITFVDNNTNSNGDLGFAGSDVLVISSWQKNHSGVWIPNGQGTSYAGTGSNLSQIVVSYYNGAVTYSYTTATDNESIVLCFKSGQTESFTPESFPDVTAVFKKSISSNESGDGYADGGKLNDIF